MTPANNLRATKYLPLVAVLLTAGVARAQPSGAGGGSGAGDGSAAGEPAVPGAGSGSGDGSMVAPIPPEPPVEPPVEEPKKDEPPPLEVLYDKGIPFRTADESFEAKLALRSQLRFETFRSLEDGAEF